MEFIFFLVQRSGILAQLSQALNEVTLMVEEDKILWKWDKGQSIHILRPGSYIFFNNKAIFSCHAKMLPSR